MAERRKFKTLISSLALHHSLTQAVLTCARNEMPRTKRGRRGIEESIRVIRVHPRLIHIKERMHSELDDRPVILIPL